MGRSLMTQSASATIPIVMARIADFFKSKVFS
jgi:hypothetical protein